MSRYMEISIPSRINDYYKDDVVFKNGLTGQLAYEVRMAEAMGEYVKSHPAKTPYETRFNQYLTTSRKVHFASAMCMNAIMSNCSKTYERVRPLLMDAFCENQSDMSEMVENNDPLEFNLTQVDRPLVASDSVAKSNYHKKLLEGFDKFRVALRHKTLNEYLQATVPCGVEYY
jgi:hypothetical protein